MWNEIRNNDELLNFMKNVHFFHDSCIKEIKYLSGAYVDQSLAMYPINDQRVLNIIIQSQNVEHSVIEMEFRHLKFLKLFPVDESYTCEILNSTMIMKDGFFYWSDIENLSASDIENYTGTLICASKLRWRFIKKHIGKKEFYHADL